MALRILVMHPLTKTNMSADDHIAGNWSDHPMDWYEESMQRYAKKVTRPDTEVVQWFADKPAASLQNLYLGTVATLPLVNKMIKAEHEGFDAVVFGCHGDNGVQMARSVLQIPVVGPCEASMAVGSFIGEKFAMITIREQYLRLLEYNIRLFGFEDRFIKNRPVRWLDRWAWNDLADAHRGKPGKLLELFEKTALECVRDGADTILVPGFPFGAALVSVGYKEVANTGVPVVDGAASAYKMAESLAELRKSIGLARTGSQYSQFQRIPADFLDRVRRGLGL
jgi:allantoin racemase